MAKYRRLSRTVALQTLTALLIRQTEDETIVEECFQYVKQEFSPELREKDEFARNLVEGVLQNRKNLDESIYTFAPEWPIEKLSPIERVILEIGTYELIHILETPLAVIINEWVDLAKEFGDETAGKFINGVLSNLGHNVRPNTDSHAAGSPEDK